MAYVRKIRLEHVRAELVANRDPHLQVTEVASRWGFFHLGRFAQQYRARYGESPSDPCGGEFRQQGRRLATPLLRRKSLRAKNIRAHR
jgi:AraC-like DNA-binding protein